MLDYPCPGADPVILMSGHESSAYFSKALLSGMMAIVLIKPLFANLKMVYQ